MEKLQSTMKEKMTELQENAEVMFEMDDTSYDLCIIGAGFFGSAAARHASLFPHMKICLIGLDEPEESELEYRNIFSSHYDEGRIVKNLFASPAYQKLCRASICRLQHLEDISGIKFYNPVGFMNIGKKGSREMMQFEDVSAAVGTSLIKIYDTQFMAAKYPFLKIKEDEYALLDHVGSGFISARKMIAAEQKVAREQGCHILFDTVKDVTPRIGDYHMVKTFKHGTIKAKRILFTTGAWTNINKFSVLPELQTYVYREMATRIKIPHSEAERLSTMPAIVRKKDNEDVGFYALPPAPDPDDTYYLKVGSMAYDSGNGMQTTEEIKAWYLSKENNTEEKEAMSKLLFELLPGLVSDGIFRKVCVLSLTPTGFPYIDRVTPTVTLAVFGNGWGATIAEEVGRLAAVLSLSGSWDSEIPKALFEMVLKEKTG